MPKQITNKKSPAETNPLVEYLVDESVREGGVPDRATNEQISLLVAETGRKSRKIAASKARRRPGGKKPRNRAGEVSWTDWAELTGGFPRNYTTLEVRPSIEEFLTRARRYLP